MQALIVGSLTVAIATALSASAIEAITPSQLEFEKAEWISGTYTYRRYNGGTGRREILS